MVYTAHMMEKEPVAIDTPTIALARANRLKRLRNLANLSRKEVCQGSTINLNTLIGWEVARHGGLTAAGARKFLNRILQEGVICSEEWLLQGNGVEPYIVPGITKINETVPPETDIQIQHVLSEIALFKKHHPSGVNMMVTDESMMPSFRKGDFVCGCIISLEDAKNYLGIPCIILTSDGKQVLRNMTIDRMNNAFCLLADNLSAESYEPLVLYDMSPIYIAPVIWHRKLLRSY